MKNNSRSTETAMKILYEALKVLKENGGELSGKKVIELVGNRIELTDWEKERYEKTGNIRWQSMLHFYSIDAIKAGYLRKSKGIWYLTDEGNKAIKLGPEKLFWSAREAYKNWEIKRVFSNEEADNGSQKNDKQQVIEAEIDQLESQAIAQIEEYIRTLNPYEFQDLVAALFRGMGYFTPFVALRGKDNGIDIVAYKDPVGIEKPTIKIQCKHYPDNPIESQDVQKLKGTLAHDEEVGIFVTSGRFSEGAKREARNAKSHIELIDFTRLVELWKQFYD